MIYIDAETGKPMTNFMEKIHLPLKYSYLKESSFNEKCKTEFVCTDLYSSKSSRLQCFGSSGSPLMRSNKSVLGLQSVVARPKGSWVACLGKTLYFLNL